MQKTEITETVARKVVDTVRAGLTNGKGQPVPGQMCVEAAVCFAMGLPHSDKPTCVSPFLRSLKIAINDASGWTSKDARARGLLRLSVCQLGSEGVLDEALFRSKVQTLNIQVAVPFAFRAAAQVCPKHKDELLKHADLCEAEPSIENAYAAANAAYAAANAAANAAKREKFLMDYAESVVQILIEMDAPGCKWLYLTEDAS